MLSPLICILFMPLKSDDKTFLLFQNHTKLHIFHLNAPIFSLSQQFALNALSPPAHCCAMRPITLVGILQDCGVKTRRRIATRSWPVPGKTPDTEGQGLGSVQHLGSEAGHRGSQDSEEAGERRTFKPEAFPGTATFTLIARLQVQAQGEPPHNPNAASPVLPIFNKSSLVSYLLKFLRFCFYLTMMSLNSSHTIPFGFFLKKLHKHPSILSIVSSNHKTQAARCPSNGRARGASPAPVRSRCSLFPLYYKQPPKTHEYSENSVLI